MRSLIVFFSLFFVLSSESQNYYLFVGTYTQNGSNGIYVYRFDGKTGKLEKVSDTKGTIVNPSFLTIAPNKKFIYACTDTKLKTDGSVSAFSFNDSTGVLKFINKQNSGGANPVYLSVHKSNKFLVNANYTGGNISVFPINADGSLAPFSQLVQDSGKSVNTERQEKAHVHSLVFSYSQKELFAPDLGTDKIMGFAVNEKKKEPLSALDAVFVSSVKGSGPRHFTFHPNGKFAYCIEELTGTVAAYKFSKKRLDTIQRIAAHNETKDSIFSSADIHVSPDGKFLYASNRRENENNLAIFSIDQKTGKLKLLDFQPTHGEIPRNFIIEPSGKFILVANQLTGNVVVFERNTETGFLNATGEKINVSSPSCLQLMEIK
ncbi:MAG: lactonase family protein [Bacteroidia bacterium]|nr:lactonase family protein [Bacteroidia bacterium]